MAVLLAGCSSSSDPVEVTYAPLSDLPLNQLTGSAMNGDPLGREVDGGAVRWRASTATWEHVGRPVSGRLYPECEDAAGNMYGIVLARGTWMLPAGSMDWIPVPLVDGDASWDPPFANTKGDLAIQAHHGGMLRIYRKNAGSSELVLASERPDDKFGIHGFADSGDVFLQTIGGDPAPAYVLPAGASTIALVVDCSTTIEPYCGLSFVANTRGDLLFFGGGIGTRHVYKLDTTSSYPATGSLVFDLPDEYCCFEGGPDLLGDGTVVGRMHSNDTDADSLFLRTSDASVWSQSTLPNDDGEHSADILATLTDELYTASINLGDTNGSGPAFRVSY